VKFAAPVRLTEKHDTTTFENGKHPSLDDWLRKALTREDTGRTFVVCEQGTDRVVGYYALTAASVQRERVPGARLRSGLPNDVPVMLLGRLARDKTAAGYGLGGSLMTDAIGRVRVATESVAAWAIIVHPIDDEAADFYGKYGFLDMPNSSASTIRTMFLALSALR
jgi:predicted N-acetyltransferase YhbS